MYKFIVTLNFAFRRALKGRQLSRAINGNEKILSGSEKKTARKILASTQSRHLCRGW